MDSILYLMYMYIFTSLQNDSALLGQLSLNSIHALSTDYRNITVLGYDNCIIPLLYRKPNVFEQIKSFQQ